MREPQRLAVLAPNWLGDAVMALPAIADLKRQWPTARLVVAARASVAAMFELAPDVDRVLTLGWRGRIGDVASFRADVRRLRGEACDAALALPNSFASAWLSWCSGIRGRWGYARDARSWLLTRAVARPTGSRHQGAYYQWLVHQLGIANGPLEPRLVARPADIEAARTLLSARGWDGRRRLVAVAPGAAYGTAKQWLPSHFSTLITQLTGEDQATCALVGSAADAAAIRVIRDALPSDRRAHAIDLAGATTLQQLAGVLVVSSACVSNDSGSMHMAAALGVPVVAMFGPTREHETAPLAWHGRPSRVLTHPVDCRPCMLRECPIDHRCMSRLLPSEVHAAVTAVAGSARP
jgi:heptosyltransferase-2